MKKKIYFLNGENPNQKNDKEFYENKSLKNAEKWKKKMKKKKRKDRIKKATSMKKKPTNKVRKISFLICYGSINESCI